MVLGCILSANVSANRMDSGYYGEGGWPFVGSLSVGPAWTRAGEWESFSLQPDIEKTYAADQGEYALRLVSTPKGTHTLATGELFLGVYGPINSIVQGQIGLAIATSSSAKLTGDIYEDANPAFNNYNYSYSVRTTRVAIKGKALYDPGFYDLFPYVSASAGVGFNHASSFKVAPKIEEEVPAPLFTDQTSKEFSYTLGIGLQTPVDPNWQVGLGYEFSDWGQSNLGRAPGQTLGRGLHVNTFRVHGLQVSLTYIA